MIANRSDKHSTNENGKSDLYECPNHHWVGVTISTTEYIPFYTAAAAYLIDHHIKPYGIMGFPLKKGSILTLTQE